jgi:hypothetical protein
MAAASELNDRFVICRNFGHRWVNIPYDGEGPAFWKISKKVTNYEVRCTGCASRRYDCISNVTGDLVERKMRYSPGYLLSKGSGNVKRSSWRMEAMQRNMLHTFK